MTTSADNIKADNDNEDYMEITIDRAFIGNSLTAYMHMDGSLPTKEYLSVEYIEMEGPMFNIIVKRNTINVN